MKKFLALLCSICVIVLSFSSCGQQLTKNTWETRKTPLFSTVPPSPWRFGIELQIPTASRMQLADAFEIQGGFGQPGPYVSVATLTLSAPGFHITDSEGNTVNDEYTFVYEDFDSEPYLGSMQSISTFRFRYIGGVSEKIGYTEICFSLHGEIIESIAEKGNYSIGHVFQTELSVYAIVDGDTIRLSFDPPKNIDRLP